MSSHFLTQEDMEDRFAANGGRRCSCAIRRRASTIAMTAGRIHAASARCSLLVAAGQQDRLTPCHYIPLNPQGETVADLYGLGSQELLDQRYRNWLKEKIQELTTL